MKLFKRTDLATVSGIALALIGLLVGLYLEGIHLNEMGQLTAALIVFCGTAGAVLISMPLEQVRLALKSMPGMLYSSVQRSSDLIEVMLSFARASRLRGIVSLEQETELIEDPFLRKAMRLAVDAVGPEMIRSVLNSDIAGAKAQAETVATVFETGAGYAPTLGMAGAAIGLIQVLKHLDHVDQVGMGVASAFVATIYGLLLANLVLLPIATKIRARTELRAGACDLIRDGVVLIASGVNPSLIRLNLEALAQIGEATRADSGSKTATATVQ
jgi:chemotaxis protein MotA